MCKKANIKSQKLNITSEKLSVLAEMAGHLTSKHLNFAIPMMHRCENRIGDI